LSLLRTGWSSRVQSFQIAAAACGIAFIGCDGASQPPRSSDTQPLAPGVLRGANVLLVTVDTLRADRVGAYGSGRGLTPTIDSLANEGLRFDRTYAHVPLTLPSHASLLTATYPTRNGVRDNGAFRLPENRSTVATALESAGYRTGAFVGAFVLDARFGLNRGFDVYDDRMRSHGSDLELAERPAEQVFRAAARWILDGQADAATARPGELSIRATDKKWFAWVHVYDPHEPYAPPEPYQSRYSGAPYDGEIAYADAALGAFLARLRTAQALINTLIVLASDHGESLGEHGERTHGLFAYDATLRVPLVMWAPSRIRPGVFSDPMRLIDVVPTLLDLVGEPPLADADGRTVRPAIAGERPFDDRESYFEALNASLTRDWAPLTGVVRGRHKLIDLPLPELYDLSADPGEQHNIYAQRQEIARDLESRLDRTVKSAAASSPAPIDADADARLRSLGYIVASDPRAARKYTPDDDPKRLVHLNTALDDAAARFAKGDASGAIDELRGIVRERPSMTIAYDRLAFALRAIGRIAEAVDVLDAAARDGRADRTLLRSLGSALRDAGDLKRSAAVLESLAKGDASDLQSADALAQTYTRMRRSRDAELLFRRVLAASPNAATTWNNLGALFLTQKRTADAIDALSRAVAINPDLAGAHNGLGVAYAEQGRREMAIEEWRKAVSLRPGFADALYNLERAGDRVRD